MILQTSNNRLGLLHYYIQYNYWFLSHKNDNQNVNKLTVYIFYGKTNCQQCKTKHPLMYMYTHNVHIHVYIHVHVYNTKQSPSILTNFG